MMTGSNADGILIEHLADVVGVDAFEKKRQDTAALCDIRGAVDREVVAKAIA